VGRPFAKADIARYESRVARGIPSASNVFRRAGDACFEIIQGLLIVFESRRLVANEARSGNFGAIAGDLHLLRQRKHVRYEASPHNEVNAPHRRAAAMPRHISLSIRQSHARAQSNMDTLQGGAMSYSLSATDCPCYRDGCIR